MATCVSVCLPQRNGRSLANLSQRDALQILASSQCPITMQIKSQRIADVNGASWEPLPLNLQHLNLPLPMMKAGLNTSAYQDRWRDFILVRVDFLQLVINICGKPYPFQYMLKSYTSCLFLWTPLTGTTITTCPCHTTTVMDGMATCRVPQETLWTLNPRWHRVTTLHQHLTNTKM